MKTSFLLFVLLGFVSATGFAVEEEKNILRSTWSYHCIGHVGSGTWAALTFVGIDEKGFFEKVNALNLGESMGYDVENLKLEIMNKEGREVAFQGQGLLTIEKSQKTQVAAVGQFEDGGPFLFEDINMAVSTGDTPTIQMIEFSCLL